MAITIREHALPLSEADIRKPPPDIFSVSTLLTSDPTVVHDWIQRLRTHYIDFYSQDRLLLGIAVKLNFPAAVVTLCTGQNCLMVLHRDNPAAAAELNTLFNDFKITFVSLSPQDVIRRRISSLNMNPGVLLNVHDYDFHEFLNSTVLSITRKVTEIWYERTDADFELSDWEAPVLKPEQVSYATVEALLPVLIGDGIGAWRLRPDDRPN